MLPCTMGLAARCQEWIRQGVSKSSYLKHIDLVYRKFFRRIVP